MGRGRTGGFYPRPTDDLDALPAVYHLLSDDLLSKWGFGDGDMFDDLCWALEQAEGIDVDGQDVLKAAVRRWMLPRLRQRVEVVEIETIHNPIRASTVDGESVEHFWYEVGGGNLEPRTIEVPTADIVDMVRQMAPIEGTATEVIPDERRLGDGGESDG